MSSKRSNNSTVDRMGRECLAMRTRLLSRTVTGVYDEALRPLGITIGQLNILAVVAKRGPMSQGEVAQFLSMEKSTMSRNVERMRHHGWLREAPGGNPGRRMPLEVSAPGRRMLVRAAPRWAEAQAEATALLGKRGAAALHGAADTIWAKRAET